jgi:hypothetical protein
VNEFLNGCEEPMAESRWNTPNPGRIPPKITHSRTAYALGARDRQFKSGHPDFYFHSSKRIIHQHSVSLSPLHRSVTEFVTL